MEASFFVLVNILKFQQVTDKVLESPSIVSTALHSLNEHR